MMLFENTQDAFLPFFDESIAATTKTGETQTLVASIFQDVEDDPISDSAMESIREGISINVPQEAWVFVQRLKRGDTIFRPSNGKKYAVSEVANDFALGIIIKARSV